MSTVDCLWGHDECVVAMTAKKQEDEVQKLLDKVGKLTTERDSLLLERNHYRAKYLEAHSILHEMYEQAKQKNEVQQ